ncbi:MAG: bifunctional folylpolyglutamate synthase/dihydrofolate synthase [Candidatus Anammoxibacter sp.]
MGYIDSSYEETTAFLLGAIDYEKISKYKYDSSSFDLDRMERLLDVAGNPHHNLKTVHVAGTKGKGSTSIMIASILQETQLKVGLFTSPHLINLSERIKINGNEISREAVCASTNILRPFIENERKKDLYLSPTFFETLTAIALIYFKNQAVDVAIMEVGLGGRLDSTNIINPLVSVIVNIGFDHTDKLGTTLEQIAGEKAGIIKEAVPVVSSSQKEEALRVLQNTCSKKKSKLTLVGRDIVIGNAKPFDSRKQLSNEENNVFGSLCDILTTNNQYRNLFIPLPGYHQIENSACAIGAAEIAIESFPDNKAELFNENRENTVRDALKLVKCPGRIEIVSQHPLIIVDSAHTVESIEALQKTVDEYIKPGKITLMLGLSQDKNINGILNKIAAFSDTVIFTTTGNPRSANPRYLYDTFNDIIKEKSNKTSYFTEDISEALEIAMKVTEKSDMICITGSTFLAGKVKSLLASNHNGS